MLVIRITQLQDLVEMSDGEMGSATTPGAEKLVKFANPTQVGAMFPALQSRCSIQKGLLTKALNSVKSSKDEFCQAIEGNTSALTKKRKAAVLSALSTVSKLVS